MKLRMENKPNFKMIENEEGTIRYEFFGRAIMKSNVDNTIAYYEPIVRYCRNLGTGSTCIDYRMSVEEGNRIFKERLAEGFKVVTERTFA